jgi:hypothetical protein
MASMRCLDHDRFLQIENVFTAKQVDASSATRELVIKKEPVVIGL